MNEITKLLARLSVAMLLALFVSSADAQTTAPFPGLRSDWNGFERYDFEVDGKPVLVVTPRTPALGKPWVWHGEFFGHKPAPDIALLQRGYHIVFMSLPDELGSPDAVAHWNALYAELVDKHGFAKKAALVGLSRGGLYCFNWAIANPNSVACIYADAAVCDFKSWPGGAPLKLGKGQGSADDWKHLLDAYHFKDDAEAIAYRGNPVDNLGPLAKARVPLLHVFGDADTVVPWDENTGVVASRYRELGGSITMIRKPGFDHHPHGLDDSTPIVEFIAKNCARALDPLPCATPPMGWCSWNVFEGAIDDATVRSVADALVSSGLRDAGYTYLNLDDLWQGERDANGDIAPDPKKFPNGMKSLADYVHERGLKFGIYSDAAEKTCGGAPGSFGFEVRDAKRYASWGVDYLKYDYCGGPVDKAGAIARYGAMRSALDATGRKIVLSICEWGPREPWTWGASIGAELWRTTWDLRDTFDHGQYDDGHCGVVQALECNAPLAEFAGPHHWNDPDLLMVGIDGRGKSSSANGAKGMTLTEYRSHFSLWCMMAAPLLLSCDVRSISPDAFNIVANREVVAIDQDALGAQGRRVRADAATEIWSKPLDNGDLAVALFNRTTVSKTIEVSWKALGLHEKRTVRDLWKRLNLGLFSDRFSADVASHEVVLLRLRAL